MTKKDMLADIIEGVLSGQYGRGTAEEVADECLELFAMQNPQKWAVGLGEKDEPAFFRGSFVFAETREDALRKAKEMNSNWLAKDRYYCDVKLWDESDRDG